MNQEQLDKIYRDYNKYVSCHFLSLGYNPQDAEDLVQEVFCKVVKSIQGFRGEGLSSWIKTIADHVHKNHKRNQNAGKRKHIEIGFESLEDPANYEPFSKETQEQQLVKNQWMERVLAIINQFPKKKRQIAKLKFIHDLDNQEIAKILHIQSDVVRVHIFQARESLKHELGDSAHDLFT